MSIRFDLVPRADRDHEGGPRPLLRATIAKADLPARRPSLRIEHVPGRLLRVVASGEVLLWARVKSFYQGVWLLAASCAGRPPLPCPPIAMNDVRAVKHAPGTEAWRDAWARFFGAALIATPTMLHEGLWEIAETDAKLRDPRRSTAGADGLLDVHAGRAPTFETWALNGSNATVPLRRASPEDGSRIKALRKLARAGTLPPLLLWFVSGVDLHLLLDGHDRALAAKLEGVRVERLVVSAMRTMRWEPDALRQEGEIRRAEVALARAATNPGGMRGYQLDIVNAGLVRAFAETRSVYPRTRAYPLEGGAEAWRREVRARLAELGGADHEMLHG